MLVVDLYEIDVTLITMYNFIQKKKKRVIEHPL